MPNWKDLLNERAAIGSSHDVVRRKYLRRLARYTNRNVIAYYSGWLQKPELMRHGVAFELNDADKNAFMATIHGMDRAEGLDLILHTPGGDVAATESLVDYLRTMFGTNIRAIVPQLAMSAGTMVALSCKQILMGKHSSLGPIDPQFGHIPAHGVLEEFEQAKNEIAANPKTIPVWQAILAKYNPTIIGECRKAIHWADQMVGGWLKSGMFAGDPDADAKSQKIVKEFGDHALTLSHSRHISLAVAKSHGVEVLEIESDARLQDLILSVHHAFIHTLTGTPAYKIVENDRGIAHVSQAQMMYPTP